MINRKGDVRDLARDVFDAKYASKKKINEKNLEKPTRILLIDEVDTFLSKNFYGQTYNPVTGTYIKEISDIIDIIWKNQSKNVDQIKNIYKNSDPYRKLEQKYPDCFNRLTT